MTAPVIITTISLVISFLLIFALVPLINSTLGLNLSVMHLLDARVLLLVFGVLVLTGVLSGSYPAFYLSAFRPAVVLKGRMSSKSGNKTLRKVLVTLQFAISIFMLVGTAVIYDQMQYVQSKDLGFDKEQVMRFSLNNQPARDKYQVLRNRLLENPNITRVASSSTSPGDGFGKQLMDVETAEGVMEQKGVDNYAVDYDFFPALNIEFVAGRNFSKEYGSDSSAAVIVNEAMVKRMNWDNAIGKKFRLGVGDTLPVYNVIGVVKDFHQQSLYNPISPLLFTPNFNNRVVLVKVEGDLRAGIDYVASVWDEIFPGLPFEHEFVDESFMEQYEADQLRGRLFLGFSLMTILIACLGLLGLASYTAEQRTKEVSIRKVLGANTGGLVGLLVRDFVLLVVIAALPAFGTAYYFMNEWLQTFEYHANLNVLIFVGVLLGIMAITVITTGYHALKAASSNPAEKLKYE